MADSKGAPETRVALLAGATGLVGGHLLKELLAAPDYGRVYALTRRPFNWEHPKLANRVVQFDRLADQLRGLVVHDAFCCLGTTIAAAGSQAEFRKFDLEQILGYARAAKAAQAQRFVIVSSVGADAASKNFYLRVKGELENALPAVGFTSLDILQPGLLLGWRREMRPVELAWRILMPVGNLFLVGSREPFRGIAAQKVALAMLGAARSGRRGVYRYTYRGILQLAQSRPRAGR